MKITVVNRNLVLHHMNRLSVNTNSYTLLQNLNMVNVKFQKLLHISNLNTKVLKSLLAAAFQSTDPFKTDSNLPLVDAYVRKLLQL